MEKTKKVFEIIFVFALTMLVLFWARNAKINGDLDQERLRRNRLRPDNEENKIILS